MALFNARLPRPLRAALAVAALCWLLTGCEAPEPAVTEDPCASVQCLPGQVCSNGTRVFVEKGIRDAFLDRLRERLKGVVMGDPLHRLSQHGARVVAQRIAILGIIERHDRDAVLDPTEDLVRSRLELTHP